MTSDWDTELDDTLVASSPLLFEIPTEDDSKKTRKRCRMVKGQIRVCNAAYGNNGWLVMATIGIDGNGHIRPRDGEGQSQLRLVLGRPGGEESRDVSGGGYLFGLGHTSEDGSIGGTCMDYSSDSSSQWPNQHDFDQLGIIYGHEDFYNSYDDGLADATDICNA